MDTAWRIARLAWSPRSLPQAALEVPLLAGVKGGFIGWFLLIGILCAPAGVTPTRGHLCAGCVVSILGTVLACGLCGSIISMTLLVLLMPLREDPGIRGRARFNTWVMVPFCALAPAAVWAALAVATSPQMDAVVAPPWLAQWAIVRALASPAGVLVIATFVLAWVGWAQMSVRQRLTSGRCIACGYPLIGLAERRCPECGRDALPEQVVPQVGPGPVEVTQVNPPR